MSLQTGVDRRIVTALMLAVATVGATIFAISPLLPDIARAFGVPVARVAILPGLFSLSLAFVAPAIALTAQRLPRAQLIVWGLVVFGSAWLAALLVGSFTAVALLAMLAGAATGAVLPATYAMAADLSSYEHRAQIMGRIVSGWSIAILLVVPTMALAAQVISWRWAFGALAGCALGLAVWLGWIGQVDSGRLAQTGRIRQGESDEPAWKASEVQLHKESAEQLQHQTADQPPSGADGVMPSDRAALLASLREVLGNPSVRIVLLVNLLDMGAFYAVYSFAGTELRRVNDWGASSAGLAMAGYGLGLAIVTFNGKWIDRVGKHRSATGALLALTLILALLPWLASMPFAMVGGIIVWGIAQGTFFTAITSMATEQLAHLRGVVVALLSASTYLGVTLYTPVTGFLFGHFGYPAVGLEAASGCLLGAALLAFTRAGRTASRD